MAVLNRRPGFEVKVVSNNKALKEHADSLAHDPPNTATSYGEVEMEGAFEVHLQFTDEYACRFGVRVEFRLDGHKIDSCLYQSNKLKKAASHTIAGSTSEIGGRWHISNFQFPEFVLDLNSRTQLDQVTKGRLKSAGVITILVHRIKSIEKIVKDLGLSHHGSVDRPKQQKGFHTISCVNVDDKDHEHAIAVCNFKYRSRAMLKALRNVPTTPEPLILSSRPRTPAVEPAPNSQPANPTVHTGLDQGGLRIPELQALTSAYRGSVDGLEDLSRR